MSDEGKESTSSKIRDTVDAVKALAETVPIYDDMFQPAAKKMGKTLATLTGFVNLLLAPIAKRVWDYERFEQEFLPPLTENLKDVPQEALITPRLAIAGPTLEALRYSGEEPDLRNMFAKLLATSMDSRVASSAHPAFVEIIRQMVPDEAKIMMSYFKTNEFLPTITIMANMIDKDDNPNKIVSSKINIICSYVSIDCGSAFTYLDNLCRLGLIGHTETRFPTSEDGFENLRRDYGFVKLIDQLTAANKKTLETKGMYYRTDLGSQFCRACIPDAPDNSTAVFMTNVVDVTP